MAIELDGAVVALVENIELVVAENDELFFQCNFKVWLRGCPAVQFAGLVGIVISPDQMLNAVQTIQIRGCWSFSHREITEMIDFIFVTNDRIPIGDQFFVMFFDGFEGTIAILQNVAVTIMRITTKKCFLLVHVTHDNIIYIGRQILWTTIPQFHTVSHMIHRLFTILNELLQVSENV